VEPTRQTSHRLATSPAYSISAEAPALLDEPPELRRADGESVFGEHAATRYTSQAVLDAEQRLLDATRTPTVAALSGPAVASAIDGFEALTGTRLDAGQRHLVTAFASDDRLLLAGIGPAGAGKTTAMRAYAHVLRQSRHRLVPLATSAASADVLGRELSLPAENLHKFLHEWNSGPFAAKLRAGAPVPANLRLFALRPGDVVLVDEAGMAGTFLLDQLVTIAASRGAIVRLLGDDRQLSAVESGGALRLIATQPGTPHLTVLHRFRDPGEAAATLQLRTGEAAAIDWYVRNGRVRSGSRESMAQAAYHGWKADMLAGKLTLMAAGDGTDVTELSAQARAGRVTLPAGYVRTQVHLLYATTAHRAQGVTADTAHPLIIQGMTREIPYVLASRARENTAFYVATHDLPLDEDARVDRVRSDPRSYAAREVLLNILATEGAALSATETITIAQEEAGSLATLVPRYLHAAHQYAEGRYRDITIQIFGEHDGQDLIADPAWGTVVRRLFDAESTRWEPARLLETVKNRRELDSAESVAEVLTWRIDAHLTDATEPPRENQPCETGAEARARLVRIAATTLGPRIGERAQKETAWPALIAALRRAENAGHDAATLLASAVRSRDLRTARSISEVLAWRIGRHIATQPDLAPAPPSPSAEGKGLLPWVAVPPQAPDTDDSASLAGYLNDAAALIATRVNELADTAIRERPAWMSMLGQQPADPASKDEWLRHIAIIAAYRDQHQVTSDDPRQVLGPYREPGHAGHTAYWYTAESVLAARRLTGLDPAANDPRKHDQVRAQMAADIYQALPENERAAISTHMASRLGILWFGDPHSLGEHAVARSAYRACLTAILAERSHLTERIPAYAPIHTALNQEPLEAALAQRGRPWQRAEDAGQLRPDSRLLAERTSYRTMAQSISDPTVAHVHKAPASQQ
jgi:hypothetical protein